eukprot:4347318-Amphidinium_carterae.1
MQAAAVSDHSVPPELGIQLGDELGQGQLNDGAGRCRVKNTKVFCILYGLSWMTLQGAKRRTIWLHCGHIG